MDERTERFLAAAIERGWVTPEQVEECRKIHETVAEVGVDQSIQEILTRKGYMSLDRVRHLNRTLSVMKVGKYEILEKLGEGGAGIVYKANQEPLERVVAIKVLSARRVGAEKYLERFLREARVAVTLNHQNIVRGLDYGEADGYHYFVMEYVEGDSLFAVLRKEGTLAEKRALEITLQVVSALQHAAKYDLVHRDIKPENVLIAAGGVAKLCDLGLAKPSLVETAQASGDGTTIGTPTYMSPEQIRGKDEGDFRSDVYSLGATLYHMVTGQPPFTGESADIIVRKHLRDPITDPRELNLKLSASTAAVITKMLAKAPEDRYSSLDALADDLRSILDGRPPTNTIQLGGRTGPPPKVKIDREEVSTRRERLEGKKSRTPLVAGILVAVVALAGAAIFVLKPFGTQKEPAPAGGGAAVEPPTPAGPTPEDLAEGLYRQALEFAEKNPGAPEAAKVERYQAVFSRYPTTRAGLLAKDRLREIESAREARVRAHQDAAKRSFDSLREKAASLARAGQIGAAIAELASFPPGFEDTEYPARLEKERQQMVLDAGTRRDEAIAKADSLARAGRYEDAVAELEKLAGIGIPEIEESVRSRLADIRKAEQAEHEARERGRKVFRAEIGAAFLKAADGGWDEAEKALVEAGGRPELVYFGEELNLAWKQLRTARDFDRALRAGAAKMTGETGRFVLFDRARPVVSGKVFGANDAGIRVARGAGEETIPFSALVPPERVRIAFTVLNPESPGDHHAAAMYLIVYGFLEEAEAETRAAGVLGAATAGLESAKAVFGDYLRERAEVEILTAEGYRGRRQFEEARAILQKTAERSPWFGRARYLYGAVLVDLGKAADALPELERARDLGVKDPLLHYYLGEAYYAAGRHEDALHAFNRFAEVAEGDAEGLERVRGRITELREKALRSRLKELSDQAKEAYRKSRWPEAVELYGKLNDLLPNADDALYYIGRAYVEMGQVFDGYRRLREYLEAVPTGGKSSDAKKQVRTLEKDYRDNTECVKFNAEGQGAHAGGRYEEAVEAFDRAIKAGPLFPQAYYNRYLSNLKIGETKGAEEAFDRGLADLEALEYLDPGEKLVFEGRALLCYYLKRYDDSLSNAAKAIAAFPDRWQSYNVAGLVHHVRRDEDKAIEVLSQGIAKAPNEPTLYINRALAWEGKENFAKAADDLQTASTKKPSAWQIEEIGRIMDRILKARGGGGGD